MVKYLDSNARAYAGTHVQASGLQKKLKRTAVIASVQPWTFKSKAMTSYDCAASFARTYHNMALSHRGCPEAALTHNDTFVVGGAKRATCKEIRIGISAAALVRRGLRQPTHGLHGRPRETAQHCRRRWVADLRNPTTREHLWHPAARSVYTNAPSAVVHLIMSLR